MKVYVRTLTNKLVQYPLWSNDHQRDHLRRYLNDLGFYVLTDGDTLKVYAISDDTPIDVKIVEKVLEKLENFWYKIKGRLV